LAGSPWVLRMSRREIAQKIKMRTVDFRGTPQTL
jgi:hypothetical protein